MTARNFPKPPEWPAAGAAVRHRLADGRKAAMPSPRPSSSANFADAFGWMTRGGDLGREMEPPSGMEQCLQPGHGGADHP